MHDPRVDPDAIICANVISTRVSCLSVSDWSDGRQFRASSVERTVLCSSVTIVYRFIVYVSDKFSEYVYVYIVLSLFLCLSFYLELSVSLNSNYFMLTRETRVRRERIN